MSTTVPSSAEPPVRPPPRRRPRVHQRERRPQAPGDEGERSRWSLDPLPPGSGHDQALGRTTSMARTRPKTKASRNERRLRAGCPGARPSACRAEARREPRRRGFRRRRESWPRTRHDTFVPIVVVTEPVCVTRRSAATPATSPLIAKALAITRFARTPIRVAIVKFSAAARIWIPRSVRRRKATGRRRGRWSGRWSRPTASGSRSRRPCTRSSGRRAVGDLPSEPKAISAPFWRTMLTPNDATSSVAGDAPRRDGRRSAPRSARRR